MSFGGTSSLSVPPAAVPRAGQVTHLLNQNKCLPCATAELCNQSWSTPASSWACVGAARTLLQALVLTCCKIFSPLGRDWEQSCAEKLLTRVRERSRPLLALLPPWAGPQLKPEAALQSLAFPALEADVLPLAPPGKPPLQAHGPGKSSSAKASLDQIFWNVQLKLSKCS